MLPFPRVQPNVPVGSPGLGWGRRTIICHGGKAQQTLPRTSAVMNHTDLRCPDAMQWDRSPPKTATLVTSREKQQTNPNGDTITKYPASLPQNRQGHQQQGKSEKMSQLRGARGEVATECHVGTWHRDRERHQWENVWNAVCGLDTTDVSMLGPYCDKRIMLMLAVNNRGSGACVVWECPVLSLQLFHQSKTVWDFPGSPVVETLPSNVGGAGSIPGWGAKMIPHA